MKLGTNDIGSVYLGSNAVQKVYLGTNEVWSAFTGLLDDYPNAAAAYSLRLLRKAYTGSAIRVRRASDNTEQDIGFVGEDLDTSALTTFCSGTNGFVKTWYDQSGNGRNATQLTAASQPQIVNSGSVILEGGKPSIDFNLPERFLEHILSSNLSQPATFFIVNKLDGVAIVSSNNSSSRWQIYKTSGLTFSMFAGTVFGTSNNSFARQLIYSLFNGASSEYGFDGATALVGNTGTQQTSAIRLSRDSGTTGGSNDMQEVILYNFDQSSNRTGIETNINTYYSIY